MSVRVLFIEDDDVIRMALRMNLEDDGYDVVEAASGELGLEKFAESGFDVVLVDLRLPGMHGLEVCRRIRQRSVVPCRHRTVRYPRCGGRTRSRR